MLCKVKQQRNGLPSSSNVLQRFGSGRIWEGMKGAVTLPATVLYLCWKQQMEQGEPDPLLLGL